ncbi:MAG: biopolymer transporter ExbD [Victivallales bacterium]|nr:biopolymer transporter ExbD [Victivallales bacterium]
MSRQKQRSQLTAIGEINMTPLIDLTFLLLIIFMITAPLLEYGLNVTPPELNADALPDSDNKIVNLNRDGDIVFEKQVVDGQSLTVRLKAYYQANDRLNVMVRADGNRPYREVMSLMKAVKDSGVSSISLVTQAETR